MPGNNFCSGLSRKCDLIVTTFCVVVGDLRTCVTVPLENVVGKSIYGEVYRLAVFDLADVRLGNVSLGCSFLVMSWAMVNNREW